LAITIPFEPAAIGSTNHGQIDRDFHGRPVPQDGTARPGPFQTLRKGRNRFALWNGLPLRAEGELPE
ncbi:MAG: hypothetical protein GWO24_19410, partial [Akkermansiaceae bacterium]|nr:hypothetical protein [Akkermansiaceae bacterium]